MASHLKLALRKASFPEGVAVYEVNGQIVFPVYGASGGLTASAMAYLLKQEDGKFYSSPIMVNFSDTREQIDAKIAAALEAFREVNPDGGDMGR